MLNSISLLVLAPGPKIFDESVAAFKARKSFAVSIALDAVMNKNVTVGRYSLEFDPPSKILFKKIIAGKPSLIFWMTGGKFVAYDPIANEYASRKAPLSGPLVNRLANAVGGIEDPVAAQLSPSTMAAFLSPFKSLPGWQITRRDGTIHVERATMVDGKRALTALEFSASSKLLTKATLLGASSRLQWVFTYRTPSRSLAFSPPSGARLVTALSEHAEIHTTDPKARAMIDQSLRAYSRITSIAFTATGTAGRTSNYMSGSSFRARQGDLEWSYAGGTLTIVDYARHKSFRGACKRQALLTYLKRLNSPVEPVLRSLLVHQNPISGWFLPLTTASSKGAVKLGNVAADAIELRSALIDISLLVRRDNHLVASVASRTKDDKGQVVSEAQRDFGYISVNRKLPASTFSLAVSKPLPLSAIPK